ncbi:hypothetical protein PMIN06_012447 [Paraphaeosphaeria minitans]
MPRTSIRHGLFPLDAWKLKWRSQIFVDKVPSQIQSVKGKPGELWGYDIPLNIDRFTDTKLLLESQFIAGSDNIEKIGVQESVVDVPHDIGTELKTTMPPEEVIAKFLQRVREHLFQSLDMKFGGDRWKTLKTVVVITFP